ncbi:MAG: phytanoyl-CoA dioxygenase family protein [Opitutales bacterium]
MNTPQLTPDQWNAYETQGYFVLKGFLSPDRLQVLQDRINAIMLGEADVDYDRMLMQLDSPTGKYEDAGQQSPGHKGATLNYRKIQDLEYDRVFLELMQHPVLEDACRRVYGPKADVACFRAMFMNKPAGQGTWLPWHQDRWNWLDKDPELTVWAALDPATRANGCVQIVPGTHRIGLVNPDHASGFLTGEQAAAYAPAEKVVHLELEAGDVALLHNRLLHASDVNRSDQSRRAFSICYMDAATRNLKTGEPTDYNVIFGDNAMTLSGAA